MGRFISLLLLFSAQASASRSIDELWSISNQNRSSGRSDATVYFYGRIVNNCAFDDCFMAIVAGGKTTFTGDGGDLANIYVPENDYDTWRQQTDQPGPTTGSFVYQMQNETLSCMTIELKWSFCGRAATEEPSFSCSAVALASNWDCHLNWGLETECDYDPDTKQVTAIYTVTNMGPENLAIAGESSDTEEEGTVVVSVNRAGLHPPVVHVLRQAS